MVLGVMRIQGLIPLIVGIGLVILGFYWLKQKQLIENIPTSKIRSLAMGLVEIAGSVVPVKDRVFKSPFTEEDCVYYRYTVEELRHTGKSTYWATVKKGEMKDLFYLKDDTGMVLVDPHGATLRIARDNEFTSRWGKDPPATVKRFLSAQDVAFEGALLGINKTMRYREYFIAPDDRLYIMGTAGDNPFVEDGVATRGVEDVMIQKGVHERFYYIADNAEKTILQGYTWRVAGCIGFGVLLVIVGMIVML